MFQPKEGMFKEECSDPQKKVPDQRRYACSDQMYKSKEGYLDLEKECSDLA